MNETGLYLKIKDIVWLTAVVLGAVYIFGDRVSTSFLIFDTFQRYSVAVLVIDALYMVMHCARIFNRYNTLSIFLFSLFILAVTYSCYQNIGTVANHNPINIARYDLIAFSCIFISLLYTAEIGRMEKLFRIVAVVIALFCISTDLLILVNKQFGETTGGVNYLVGTKFTVSYMHMSLIIIYAIISANISIQKRRMTILFLIILSVAVSIKVDCNTGIVGAVLLAFMILGNEYAKGISNLLYTRAFYVVSLFFGLFFVAAILIILSNSFVQYIIVDVLDRELTLTGRTDIYANLFLVLANSILFGYGYGNSFTISKTYFGYANTQNGLSEWLLQVGLVGVVPMVLLFCYCIFSLISIDKEKEMMPIVAMLYVYNFLATVEVTINLMYLYWVFVLLAWTYLQKKRKANIEEVDAQNS